MNKHRLTTNIRNVIKNKQERDKATFVITPTNSFVYYKGDRITESHFNLMLPIEVKQFKTCIN